jgi:hypothetical protein
MYIDPMLGFEHARETVQTMIDSGYVDLQTQAVFVDATIYNADR